jgi:ABC-type nitrate/sulfonate/bicarbonate transport system substrate-binding protein
MTAMRHWQRILFGAAIVSLSSGIFAMAGAQPVLVRAGYGGTAGYQLPLWVNREAGLAKKYGIDLEILLIGAGSLNMQALVGGSIQLSQNSASAAIQAALKGAPVVIIATAESKIPFQIIARPEIKDPQQLRGRRIGTSRFGGSGDTAIQAALKAWKIDSRDVKVLQSGSTAARISALTLGHIDATIISYPEIFYARKLGMNVLGDVGDFLSYPNTSVIVVRSLLEKQRSLVKNMLKAQIEAIHMIRTNRDLTKHILKKYLKVNDPEVIDATYEFFSTRMLQVPRAETEGIKNILADFGALQRSPNDFFDMTLLDELEREGFFQRLRGN